MKNDDETGFGIAMGRTDTVAALEELRAKLESGEVACAALRIFRADGTWQDVALGGDEHDQAEALANLKAAYERSN
jgi:hypothetical protein